MALTLSARAANAASQRRIEPQLVLEIEGVGTVYSAIEVLRTVRIGDPDVDIGDAWVVGGTIHEPNQENIVSLEGSSGLQINQQLQPDRGSVSSVSSIQLALLDKDLVMSQLVSPGVVLPEILGAKATLWMGFKNTAFKDDFTPVFSGIIDDVESPPGMVKLNIAHPEQLKRQEIFNRVDVFIDGAIDGSQVTIPIVDASELPRPVAGPDGTFDPAIRFYIRVADEAIRYTGITGNNLTGCTRGSLATAAAPHNPEEGETTIPAQSLVSIEDDAVDLALKIMSSGVNGPYAENVAVRRFIHPTPTTSVANSVFFNATDLNRDFGLVAGDFITITGATNPANNCAAKIIQDVVTTDEGTYIVVGGVAFVSELETGAVASFRSQFDTLGIGLAMTPDQVDVAEHIFWRDSQLAGIEYRFVITDKINGKDFLDKEVYMPIGAFSLPRQGRASMGYHIGPLIRGNFKVLDKTNIKNPDQLKLRRTINRNFYNTIIYKFEKLYLTNDFASGAVAVDGTSAGRIKVGSKAFTIESSGLRRDLDGQGVANRVSDRYLSRYKFAAEFFESVGVLFGAGNSLEPGDIVLLDPEGLNVLNSEAGTRNKPAKLFAVTNKKLDLKTGDINVALTDVNHDGTERYGVISPSSEIVSGTTTALIIRDSFGAIFPGAESRKWADYIGLPILVHSPDWTFAEEVTLKGISESNTYQLDLDPATPLSIPPAEGYIIDVAPFPESADPLENAHYKAGLVFLGPVVPIDSASDQTHFTVVLGGGDKFKVGDNVRVHNETYTEDSGTVKIIGVVGETVEVDTPLGFVPDGSHVAEGMGFADGSKTYLIF